MTREELKAHCEKQIEMCEMWAISKGEKPSGKIYEEHKLILELLEQEPRKGHWITKIKSDLRGDEWPTNPKCSECGGEPYYSNTIYKYKFCPYCGADMREVEE